MNPENVCKPVECKSSADCGGLTCAISIDICRYYAGAYCHTSEDECQANHDCPDYTYGCLFDTAVRHWTCQRLTTCE